MEMQILKSVEDSIQAVTQLREKSAVSFIQNTAHLLSEAFTRGNKVILAGNGGSLCDASHCAEELTGLFRSYRRALPAIVLSEPGHLTCVGNDLGFEWIFARGVEAFGQAGDVFIGLTTSGKSPNIVNAFDTAQKLGLKTVALLGKGGGKLKGIADLELIIQNFTTSDRIQEAHMAAMHIIVEMIEQILFPEVFPSLSLVGSK